MGSPHCTLSKTFPFACVWDSPPTACRVRVLVLSAPSKVLSSHRLSVPSSFLQEVKILRSQLGEKLRIELDIEPTIDLNRVLGEMRAQYEAMVETNRQDVEQWFQAQVNEGWVQSWGVPGLHLGREVTMSLRALV